MKARRFASASTRKSAFRRKISRMNHLRFGQIAPFVVCLFLLGAAWKSGNALLGIGALGYLGFAIFDIVSPPQKRLEKKIETLRARGDYPPPHRLPTDADVRRLMKCGEKVLALKTYRELHPDVSLRAAKTAIERMK